MQFTEKEMAYLTVAAEKLTATLPTSGASDAALRSASRAWRNLISDLSLPTSDPRRVDAENIMEVGLITCTYRGSTMFFRKF